MKTVGQILKETRLQKKITLEQVAAATKIRLKYLRVLEADDFKKLAFLTSARGFIKNYAEFLGLSSPELLAIFRRDFSQGKKEKIILQGMIRPLNQAKFSWSPTLSLGLAFGIVFLILSAYLGYQYFSLVKKPSLEVTFPPPGEKFNQAQTEVLGKADKDSVVTINQHSVLLSSSGEFRYQLDLFPGENKIIVEAINKLGKKARVERTVFRLDTPD